MSREPAYVSQLGAVLRRRDPRALRAFLSSAAARFGNAQQVADVEGRSDQELEELMHRMIVARPDLKDLHSASRAYLLRRGIDPSGASAGTQRRN